MKPLREAPNLAMLREVFGDLFPPDEGDAGKQIRPTLWRKVYRSTPAQQWLLRPTRWLDEEMEFRPPEEIAKQTDQRHLLELLRERNKLMEQIFYRAAVGNEHAIGLLVSTARSLVRALKHLEKIQLEKLKAEAQTSVNWPLCLSLNPQDIKRAKEQLNKLGVGANPTTPRRPGQRLDPASFWTRLAADAFEICKRNKVYVPALLAHTTGANRRSVTKKLWRTPLKVSLYWVDNSHCIAIADWEKQCVQLSGPIAEANFKQWWSAVQFCVLERWNASNEDYQVALARISDRNAPKEFQKRNLAMTQVRKAFRSLVGLRQ